MLSQLFVVFVFGIIFFVGYEIIYDIPKKIKKKDYSKKYPVTTKELSLNYLSRFDIVVFKNGEQYIYDGKKLLLKKHVLWLKTPNKNVCKYFTEQELKDNIIKITCKFGLKWEKLKN